VKIHALILGAGPAGLAVASTLHRAGLEPLVLENAPRPGGSVKTHRENGFIAECGPNAFLLENDGTEARLRQLGLTLQEASAAARKRYLVCHGKATPAPGGPLGAITTPLLSLRGKLRILAEPFAAAPPADDESAAAFTRRRLGAEAATRLVEPMVAGIYAGDYEKISLRHAFPRLREMERRHGSLLLAGLRTGRAAPRRRMVNFPGGMADIPGAMERTIGPGRIRTDATVHAIEPADGMWRVEWSRHGRAREVVHATTLVLAIPPWRMAGLPLPASLQSQLQPWESVEAPPVSVISLGYARDQVTHPLDGFGMLSPAIERRHILGTLFQSTLFPGRAPEGCVLLTTFLGGSRHPHAGDQTDAGQIKDVRTDLHDLLGARGEPVFTHLQRWPRAIPQYNLGYGVLLERLDAAERAYPGLHFCGSYRAGVALPKTLGHAFATAEKIVATAV
jgi:oxygen-dependent protoporphyrinogen oxidase